MAKSTPPPTYAQIFIDGPDGKPTFNPIWIKWFVDLAGVLSGLNVAGSGTGLINLTGAATGNGTGTVFVSLVDGAASNTKLSAFAAPGVKGATAVGPTTDLTTTQLTTLVNTFTAFLPGAVPASGGGISNFLRSDGAFAPAGGGYNIQFGLGMDGEDGNDGMLVLGTPGPQGPQGTVGTQGPAGQTASILLDGIDGDEGFSIPGPQGPAGASGSNTSTYVFLADGQDGEDGSAVPGPAGVTGVAGSQGLQGISFRLDGEDGDEGMAIPGPTGLTGSPGASGSAGRDYPMMVDGQDGDDGFMIPGAAGPAGSQGVAGRDYPMMMDGIDGEDGMMIRGATGATGLTGAQASQTYMMPLDGENGDDSMVAPFSPQVFRARFTSANQTWTASAVLTIAHGFGVRPFSILPRLQCTTNDTATGYLVGDSVIVSLNGWPSSAGAFNGFSTRADATNIVIAFCAATTFALVPRAGGAPVQVTALTNWALVLDAFF